MARAGQESVAIMIHPAKYNSNIRVYVNEGGGSERKEIIRTYIEHCQNPQIDLFESLIRTNNKTSRNPWKINIDEEVNGSGILTQFDLSKVGTGIQSERNFIFSVEWLPYPYRRGTDFGEQGTW